MVRLNESFLRGWLRSFGVACAACAGLSCTFGPDSREAAAAFADSPDEQQLALSRREGTDHGNARKQRPNILLIIADDLGYSDIGAFGGEIHTPNLDRLADEGKLLTQYYTSSACAPTRAGLISGTDHHLVGLGTMIGLEPHQVGKPGYEGYLNQSALSFADLLKDSGYHTYIAGKWHLGSSEAQSPAGWGFESSFVLTGGASTHFAADPPLPAEGSGYRENGKPVALPGDFYSTDFYTDKLIGFIEAQRQDGKPFLALATYTSPHWPLQAPDAFIDRYRGRYDQGYAPIREQRIQRQKRLGIIPRAFEPSPALESTVSNPRWQDLTPEQRKLEARRMEIYAAMVENLDFNIGRIFSYLRRTGEYDNTFIFFQSDNGAEAVQREAAATDDNSYENLGRRGSYIYYGRRWAEVSATPFRQWKVHTTEGGVSVPAIARLPRQRGNHTPFEGVAHVTDLAATFLELAGAADPGSSYKGRAVHPITGHSLLPALERRARNVRGRDEALVDELFGRRYVRKGRWKLTWLDVPYGHNDWALFDIHRDRGETTDLSAAYPEVVADLVAEWDWYAEENGVVLPNSIGIPGW
jgi:arylsulfatase A-like enzyme